MLAIENAALKREIQMMREKATDYDTAWQKKDGGGRRTYNPVNQSHDDEVSDVSESSFISSSSNSDSSGSDGESSDGSESDSQSSYTSR